MDLLSVFEKVFVSVFEWKFAKKKFKEVKFEIFLCYHWDISSFEIIISIHSTLTRLVFITTFHSYRFNFTWGKKFGEKKSIKLKVLERFGLVQIGIFQIQGVCRVSWTKKWKYFLNCFWCLKTWKWRKKRMNGKRKLNKRDCLQRREFFAIICVFSSYHHNTVSFSHLDSHFLLSKIEQDNIHRYLKCEGKKKENVFEHKSITWMCKNC